METMQEPLGGPYVRQERALAIVEDVVFGGLGEWYAVEKPDTKTSTKTGKDQTRPFTQKAPPLRAHRKISTQLWNT